MSDQIDQKSELDEPISGIDNSSSRLVETTTAKRKRSLIDTSAGESAREILKLVSSLYQLADINVKNEDRKERELRYNLENLNPSKKRQFMKYLKAATTVKHKKPEIIKMIFYDNKIDSVKDGFTLTEMAAAWLEFCGLQDSITLEKMKKRIKSMISSSNTNYKTHIFGTPITKYKYIYFITKDPKDCDKQINGYNETANVFTNAAEKREAVKQEIKKDADKEEKKEIIIDNQGRVIQEESKNE